MAQTYRKVVVQNLDDPAKMLELLNLLLIRRNREQDRPDAVSQNAVGESWRVIWVLDEQQFFHALLRHLLDVLFVPLKELEEAANNLGFDLHYVKV